MEPIHPSTSEYLTDAAVAEEYDQYFDESPLFAFDTELLCQWLAHPGRVLDVGCGTGRHVLTLRRNGHEVVGIDLSVPMLDVGRQKLESYGVDALLIRSDLTGLPSPFVPESFDYAICMFSTIGMVRGGENRLRVLRGIREVLRPGGALAIHVHNRWNGLATPDGLYALVRNLWETYQGKAEFGDKILWYYRGIRDMYVHVFTWKELDTLLRRAGFDVNEIVPLNRKRGGPLRLPLARGIRANGFIARATKPRGPRSAASGTTEDQYAFTSTQPG